MAQTALTLLVALLGREAPVAELPFELVGNHIYVQGQAGDRPISVLLDSGAGLSVLDSTLAQKWDVPRTKDGVQVRGAGEGTMRAEMLKDFKVRLNGTTLEQPIILGIPLEPLKYLEGRPLEAVLGFEFFKKYVVQIDYAGRKVRFYEPTTYQYSGKGKPIPIRIIGNHPHLDGEIEVPTIGKLPVEIMLDTGAGSAVSLSGKLVDKEKLDDRLPATPKVSTGAGVGGQTFGRNVRIDSLTLGGFRMSKPVASLELGSGGVMGKSANFDVLIGGDVMRRFTVTFDYSRNQMYLEPNADFRKPFPGDQVGMYVKSEGDDLRTFRVMTIVEKSPASEAGVLVGDRIVKIDGKPAETMELYQLRGLLRQTGKTWQVEIERDGKTLTVAIKGRSIV